MKSTGFHEIHCILVQIQKYTGYLAFSGRGVLSLPLNAKYAAVYFMKFNTEIHWIFSI